MKYAFRTLVAAALLAALSGCAATVPIKVAAKTTKLGVKATKTTVKTGAALIPDGQAKESDN